MACTAALTRDSSYGGESLILTPIRDRRFPPKINILCKALRQRFITRSQRRYETQTRDYSRTPSSTTQYGLFRVSSDLRLGEHLLPVGVFPLAWPQLWTPKGWPASVGALDRSLGGSEERPVGHVSSFNVSGAPDCKQGQAASSPTLQGPGSGHPEPGRHLNAASQLGAP